MIAINAAIILCQITKVENSVFPSLGNQILCQITEVVFYTKVLVNDILVGLERFDCSTSSLYTCT